LYTHIDHHHNINCLIKKLLSSDRSIIALIIASLLISSIVTITQSPFQKASAQNTPDPVKKAPLVSPDLIGQRQQQPQQGGGEDQDKENKGKHKGQNKNNGEEQPQDFVPMATSGNNVYVVWPSNKTGDFDIMFRASSDNGKTFDSQFNVSNSTGIDSVRPEIAASGDNVFITWWERANATSNEPVARISTDNGKTFGPILNLSTNGTLGRSSGG
jgi:hypothetical protein